MKQYQSLGFQRYVIAFPCWRCNLKCPYCAYNPKPQEGYVDVYTGASKIPMSEVSPREWIGFLAPFKETLVEICGGEPLLYDGLSQIIDCLHPTSKYAMTSNTTQLKTIFKLDPSNCYSWTASYHPSASEPYGDLDFFINVLQEMKRYGYRNVACTIVYLPWKYTSEYVASIQKRFKGEGIPLNWQPYVWKDYKWKPEHLAKAKELLPSYLPDWDDGRLKTCGAGDTAFAVNCDGTVYRCLSTLTFNGDPLGNIKTGWNPIKSATECVSSCMWTCDYWNNDVRYDG